MRKLSFNLLTPNCLIVSTLGEMRQFIDIHQFCKPEHILHIADAGKWCPLMQTGFSTFMDDYAQPVEVFTSSIETLTPRFISMFHIVNIPPKQIKLGEGSYSEFLEFGDGSNLSVQEIAPDCVREYMLLKKAPFSVRRRIESWGIL